MRGLLIDASCKRRRVTGGHPGHIRVLQRVNVAQGPHTYPPFEPSLLRRERGAGEASPFPLAIYLAPPLREYREKVQFEASRFSATVGKCLDEGYLAWQRSRRRFFGEHMAGETELRAIKEILKDLLIVQLAVAGVPMVKIRDVVGCDNNRVSTIFKHVKKRRNSAEGK